MNLWETFLCLFVWRGSVTPLRVSFFIALSFTQREKNFSQWVILKTLTAELNYSDLYFERSVYCSCSWCLLFSCWRINTLAQPLYLYISYQCVLVLRQIRWNKIWKDPKQTKQNKKPDETRGGKQRMKTATCFNTIWMKTDGDRVEGRRSRVHDGKYRPGHWRPIGRKERPAGPVLCFIYIWEPGFRRGNKDLRDRPGSHGVSHWDVLQGNDWTVWVWLHSQGDGSKISRCLLPQGGRGSETKREIKKIKNKKLTDQNPALIWIWMIKVGVLQPKYDTGRIKVTTQSRFVFVWL